MINDYQPQYQQEVLKAKQTPEGKSYLNTFCVNRNFYGKQLLPKIVDGVEDFGGWYCVKKEIGGKSICRKLNDYAIHNHREQKYWIGVKAGWYQNWGLVDVDIENREEQIQAIKRVANILRVDETDNKLLCIETSPKGRLHILFKTLYNDKSPTYNLFEQILKNKIYPYELFPNHYRWCRLPFGARQCRLLYDDVADCLIKQNWGWQEQMRYFDELEPIELSGMEFEHIKQEKKDKLTKIRLTFKQECEELLLVGLQTRGMRHDSQYKLLSYYARENVNQREAVRRVKRWIRAKHNGYSKEVSKGHWRFIDKDIEGQADYVYDYLENAEQYPDFVHNNLVGYATIEDLALIKAIERAIIKALPLETNPYIILARLFNFICYVRPRRHHDWIYIPRWAWQMITGDGTARSYIAFRNALEEHGIIIVNHHYYQDEFSKSIKLLIKMRPATEENAINIDGRACHELSRAVLRAYPGIFCGEFMKFTGASERTYYRAKNKVNLIL